MSALLVSFGEAQVCWILSRYIQFILMGDIFLNCTVSGVYFIDIILLAAQWPGG